MWKIKKCAIGFSLLLTDVVILSSCLCMLVSFGLLTEVHIMPFRWLLLGGIAYLVNTLLAQKEVRMSGFVIWNLLWMAFSFCFVWMQFSCHPNLMLLRILVPLIIVAIEAHSCNIALEPPKAEQCLAFLDVLAIVFILFLAGSRYQMPGDISGLVVLGFANLVYLVIVMILLRTSNGVRRVIAGDVTQSRGKVIGLVFGLFGLAIFVCVVLFGAMRQTAFGLRELLIGILQGARGLLLLVERFFVWLFRLLGMATDDGTWGYIPGYGQCLPPIWEGLTDTLLLLVLIIVAVIIFAVFLKTVQHRFSKKPAKSKTMVIVRERCKQVRVPFLRHILDKITLYLLMRRNRRTPEGLLVLAKKQAKKVGVTMEAEDSWHRFIEKLIPYGEEDTLHEFAEYLKRYFYRQVSIEFTTEQYLKYKKCLRDLNGEKRTTEDDVKKEKKMGLAEQTERDVFRQFHV